MSNHFEPKLPEAPSFTNQDTHQPIHIESTPESTGEILHTPETQTEQVETKKITREAEKNFLEEAIGGLTEKLKSNKKKPHQIPQVKDPLTVDIEKVMEQDLADAYRELSPTEQQAFKIKGEEVAWEIRTLLKQTHIKVKNIFRLILEWLKMLPGINRFFLEQEAKIKTDKIIALKDKHQ